MKTTAETKNTQEILIKMLRKKQEKLGINYLKTSSRPYKIIAVLTYIFYFIVTVINLIFVVARQSYINTILANAGELNEYQSSQISEIKNNIYTVIIMGILIVLGAIFLKFRKQIAQLVTTQLPSMILIFSYASISSNNIDDGDPKYFIFRHLLPLLILMAFSAICGIIAIRQKILDKKGTNEISDKIYRKYSLMAGDLTEQQWQDILEDVNIK